MTPLADPEAMQAATRNPKKPAVITEQKLNVRYHVEKPVTQNRVQQFLEIFATILKHSSYGLVLEHYMRTSMKCSRCTTQCMLYQATGDPKDIPCYRSELLLSVYRRHFTVGGYLRSKITTKEVLTDAKIEEMAQSFWNCTACRKCMLDCPSGIDHGLITHLGRYILSEMGIAPRALVVSVREQLEGKTGNTSAIPLPALKDTLEFLEEDMEEEKGMPIKFPLDQEKSDYVFFPAVSDFLMEADTLMGNAAVFYATGDKWTIGTQYYDGINYGLFYSDRMWDRIVKKLDAETRRLKGKTILIGECGHASRSAKVGIPMFCGGKNSLPVMNIMEYTWDALKKGRIKLDPNIVTEKVTYHDPCNIARSGWIIDQPREILRSFCKNYVEMTPSGQENICCGGGGGTVSIDEIRPYRTGISGRAKAEQMRATGAKYVVAPCANCKKQLREVVEDNGLDCEIVGLHDLIYKAIILEPKPEMEEVEDEEAVREKVG